MKSWISEVEHVDLGMASGYNIFAAQISRPPTHDSGLVPHRMLQKHHYQLGTLTVIEIEGIPDHRLSNAPAERWLLGRHVETALYGDAGTGALLKLLGR